MHQRALLVILVATVSTPAFADYDCKKTETQAECHARLGCGPDEELDQCQKRLRAGSNNGNNGNNNGGDRRNDRGDRGDRGDRSDRRGGGGDDNRRSRRRNRNRGGRSSSSFSAKSTFGLGFELGEPTGLTGKYFLSDSRALDFGIGYVYETYYFGNGFHLYADHLWHPAVLTSSPTLDIPFYIGVGLRYWNFEYCERVGNADVCDGGSALGARIPIGISLDFNNAPLDIFFQLVPVVDFAFGDYYDRFRDRNHFGIDGSIGLRFWFK